MRSGYEFALTCLQVNKVEKFKRSQAKEDALHAKYNLSEWLQVLFLYYWMECAKFNMYILLLFYIYIFTYVTPEANFSL